MTRQQSAVLLCLAGAVALGAGQVTEQRDGTGIEGRVAIAAGLLRQRLSQEALAHAGGA